MEDLRRAAFAAAAQRWPQIVLDFERFAAHLDALGEAGALPKHADSVFLCCACAAGDPAACRALEDEYIAKLRPAVAAVDRRDDFIAETLQRAREKLLSGPRAKIKSYSGRGPLLAWLGVVARRVALNQVRSPAMARERPLDLVDRLLEQVGFSAPGTGLESRALQARYAPVFSDALAHVLKSLPARERGMLRLQLVQGLNPEAIAVVYNVNRATVYRWLERCHERILSGVRGQLANELGAISTNEFQSLYRIVESQLRVSLAELLRSAPDLTNAGDPSPDRAKTGELAPPANKLTS